MKYIDAKIKQKELVDKSNLNARLKTLATTSELKIEQDIIVKLQTYC